MADHAYDIVGLNNEVERIEWNTNGERQEGDLEYLAQIYCRQTMSDQINNFLWQDDWLCELRENRGCCLLWLNGAVWFGYMNYTINEPLFVAVK